MDWEDPAERARYQREAARVSRPLRIAGLILAILGAALAGARAAWWPALPNAIPMLVIAAALLHLLAAIIVRLRKPGFAR